MSDYLSIENVSFFREEVEILKHVSFVLGRGDVLSIMGESGGGKTTLLRLIAGLEKVQQGVICLAGDVIASENHHVPPQKRNIGMVFQAPSLFPHLTVAENIAFGVSHIKGEQRREIVGAYANKVGMHSYMNAYPNMLSGGQQQRVAIARALICKPSLMLLDEPFSSLDNAARQHVRDEVKQLLQEEKVTTLLVTHDDAEAHLFADRVLHVQGKTLKQT